jgi:ABC-2 type transport system permease protein
VSRSVVLRLVAKDLHLVRPLIIGSLVAGVASLAVMPWSTAAFFVGGVSYMVVLIVLNTLVVTLSVTNERKERTALFVLSLPVSTAEYARSKLVSSSIAFVGPAALLTTAAVVMLDVTPLPDGFIPFAVALSCFLLLYFCAFLAVGLVTDSQAWITAVIIAGNVSVTFVFQLLLQLPSMGNHLAGPVAVWGADVIAVIALEIVLSVAALAAALFVHARKRDFV